MAEQPPHHHNASESARYPQSHGPQQGTNQGSTLSGTTPSQSPKKLGPMDLLSIDQQDTSQGSTPDPGTTPPQSSRKVGPKDLLFINQQDTSQGSTPHSGTTPSQPPKKADPMNQLYLNHDLAVVNNYDPLWMKKQKLDHQSVHQPCGDMTFEKLCYEGVIRRGDYLVIAITRNINGVSHQDEAVLTHTGFSEAGVATGHRPDIAVTLRQATDFSETIVACKGTGTILDKLEELHFSVPGRTRNTIAPHFNVWRGDQHLGTLQYVQQAYRAWRNDLKERLNQMKREHKTETEPRMEDRGPEKEKEWKWIINGVPAAEE